MTSSQFAADNHHDWSTQWHTLFLHISSCESGEDFGVHGRDWGTKVIQVPHSRDLHGDDICSLLVLSNVPTYIPSSLTEVG